MAEKLELKSERELVTNVYNNNYSVFEHRPMQVSDDSNEMNMLVRTLFVSFWCPFYFILTNFPKN
jgi:hypothetical protein